MSCIRYYTSALFYTTVLITVLGLFDSYSCIFTVCYSITIYKCYILIHKLIHSENCFFYCLTCIGKY